MFQITMARRQAKTQPLPAALLLVALMLSCAALANAESGLLKPLRALLSSDQRSASARSSDDSSAAHVRVKGAQVVNRRMLEDGSVPDASSSQSDSTVTDSFPYKTCSSGNSCEAMPLELVVGGIVEDAASTRTQRVYTGMIFRLQPRPPLEQAGDGAGSDSGCGALLRGLRELRIKLRIAPITDASDGDYLDTAAFNPDSSYKSGNSTIGRPSYTITATVNGIAVPTSIPKPPSDDAAAYLSVPLDTLSSDQIAAGDASIALTIASRDGSLLSLPDYIIDFTEYVTTYPPKGSPEDVDPANRVAVYSAKIRYSLLPANDEAPCCPSCLVSLMQTKLEDCPSCGGGSIYLVCINHVYDMDCYRACTLGCRFPTAYLYGFARNNYPYGCVPCLTHPSGWCNPTNTYQPYCCSA